MEPLQEGYISQQKHVLSLSKILKAFVAKKRILAIAVGIGFAAALIVKMCISWGAFGNEAVSAAFELYFDGIENGQTPTGEPYDVSEIKSTEVLEAAIRDTGLPVSAAQVANHLQVEGVLSEDAAQQRATYASITNEELKLAQADQFVFYPTKFILTLQLNDKWLSAEQGEMLMNSVIREYRAWVIEKYNGSAMLGNVFSGDFSLDSYDYIQIADLFSRQLDTMQNYVDANITSDAFISASTGYSRASLTDLLSSIRNNEVERIYTVIASEYVTKDKNSVVAVYENLILQKQQDAQKYTQQANTLYSLLQTYSANEQQKMVFTDGNTQEQAQAYILKTQSEQYDKMVSEYIAASSTAGDALADAKYYQDETERMRSEENSSENTAVIQEIQTLIAKAQERIAGGTDTINTVTTEFRSNAAYQKYVEMILPAGTYSPERGQQTWVILLIGILAGFVGGCIVIFGSQVLHTKANSDKEQEGADE